MLLGGKKLHLAAIALLTLAPVVSVIMTNGPLAASTEPFFSPTPGTTTCVSISSSGAQGNSYSDRPSISGDGRYVAFQSRASNLVGGDRNGAQDIFVHDREAKRTVRVSVASDGGQGNRDSLSPAISSDGRYVAFESYASNLVSGDTNEAWDVFVHDRETAQTTRVSVASDGGQGNRDSLSPAISSDGRYVAFASYANNLVSSDSNSAGDIFVHDQQTGETTRVSVASDGGQADDDSVSPSISADGRYVAFVSYASNLVSDDTNGVGDVFVHDRQTGEARRVSVASDGSQTSCRWILCSWRPSISADGRYVVFLSSAGNLVEGDTNGTVDVFLHDRQTGETMRVSVASDGSQGSYSGAPSLSGDGRLVAFWSYASNLVGDDANGWIEDIFVRDRQRSETVLGSVAPRGTQGNAGSRMPSVSADGCCVAFRSVANNLVRGDANGMADIFVRDLRVEAQQE